MKKSCRLVPLLAFALSTCHFAHAQATRTWISGVGDDANPCSRTAPCKTIAGAISKTATGGEIDALDPGGFGGVTITKSITIDGGGMLLSDLVSGTNGITVSAPTGSIVNLRNMSIQGLQKSGSGGLNGVDFTSGAALHIENCVIMGFNDNGINIAPSAGGSVYINNTTVEDNLGNGLNVVATGANVQVAVSNSRFLNNVGDGVLAGDFSNVTVFNSSANGNAMGFVANANNGTAMLALKNSEADLNQSYSVSVGGGSASSTLFASGVTTFNALTYQALTNGTIETWGDNVASGTDDVPDSAVVIKSKE